ncbi:MAG: Rho termination factor N-terminal domain-containing protein [Prevotella sp.]|nr:Rho termination factor N-terminal domain-containing protein [Prevotella sp.]
MSENILQSKGKLSETELNECTCGVLRNIAKDYNISGRWDMTKHELIEAILRARNAKFSDENVETQSANDECKVDNQVHNGVNVEVEAKVENESAGVPNIDFEQKMRYVENIEIGTIVAFRLSNGKVKSAKVVKKSTKNRKLKLETDYGAEYIVPYESVVWVRTGKRWPKGVYKLLKGTVHSDSE